ncbi:hypothetical protein HZB97_00480 [Candidatus Gottesmanbacteria bacterium]|nr:hypothetical protein [Candidatus Gottesmanbacteria bacterium]
MLEFLESGNENDIAEIVEEVRSGNASVEGFKRTRFSNPYTNRSGCVAGLIAPFRRKYYFHYPQVLIDAKSDRCVVDSSRLLPAAARYLYGFYDYPDTLHASCHYAAIIFNHPELRHKLERETYLESYVEKHYGRLAREERPRFGDHIVLYGKGLGREEEAIHSMIYVSPDLVFSKSGNGAGVPFYLQEAKGVYRQYRWVEKKLYRPMKRY